MKVIHYWPHLFFLESSGPANSILGWTRALNRIGIEATVVADEEAVRVRPPDDVDCVFVKHVGRGHFRIPLRLPVSEAEDTLIVTHGGWTLTNIIAGAHARRRHTSYIVMPHNVYEPHVFRRRAFGKNAWFALLEKPYLNKAAAVHIFFSDEELHLTSLHVSSPVVVAPNGIEPPDGVRWDGGSGGYVLWLGRYDPMNKGLDILLRGLSQLSAADRPRLLLHGRDYRGGREVVARLRRELQLEESVSIGDPVHGDDKWQLLAQAKGFVHPSRWEGSSMAVAEAISIGTPTLVADYPMGRFLASRGAAILVEPTPSGVARGTRRLLSDEAGELGARGFDVARRELSWDVLANSWIKQVEKILDSVKE
jgi:glycosyltransferase involved in cell wall biosynthesis